MNILNFLDDTQDDAPPKAEEGSKKIGRSRDKTISVEEPVRGSAETGKPGKKKGPDSLSEESEHAENSEPVSEDIEVLFPEELKEYVEKVTIGKLSRYGLGRGLGMSKIALYFVALSYMGTLTNITMFNYSMHRQGFVFIIPYLCCVYCISFPMVYLELALGQYTHASVLTIFDLIAPISVGVGVSALILTLLSVIVSNDLVAMAFRIFFNSLDMFGSGTTWNNCMNPHSSEHAVRWQGANNGGTSTSSNYV
ncbi:hypothetical protein Q1695_010113 [Nippostrongylus brasiliensis]|nr:hypothetical protein Q1695_010113 [Nippostrongylus brasiliensis]